MVTITAVPDPYFTPLVLHREVLSWSVATRLQLDRWEPLVARVVRESPSAPSSVIWQSRFEHHFALVAACNLFRALDMLDPPLPVDTTLRRELIEGRDLVEHWDANMPVFNVRPGPREPRFKTGKSFAERNPERRPYFWLTWSGREGPKLLPNVPASDLTRCWTGADSSG